MVAVQIAFQSNPGRYNFEGTTQLVNAYAEKRGDDAKGPLSVLACDGIVTAVSTAFGTCRGLKYMEDLDKLYGFNPSSAYRYTSSGGTITGARIATIPGVDWVELSRNRKTDPQLIVRHNAGVQVIESDSASFVTDEDLPDNIVTQTTAAGYTSYGEANGRYTISALNSAKVVDALDFATFEQRSDTLLRQFEHAGELVGFKSRSLEFWRNVADEDFPFAPIGFKSTGMMAANSLAELDNTLYWVGDDGSVYKINNYDPQRVSTHSIERLIQEEPNQAGILGFAWSRGGHAFYAITGTNWTRVYDAATGVWHSRESYGYTHWRARYSEFAWGRNLVGDEQSGSIGYFDSNTYTEFGQPIVWKVVSPPMHAFPNGGVVDALHMDVATGYGTLSGQGSNPKLMLRVSVDGGNTFREYRELELGVRGKYATRVTARRLGAFGKDGMVFELSVSDPVARGLVSTDVEVRPMNSR